MAHLLTQEDCGIAFGTEVTLLRPSIKTDNIDTLLWFSLSGKGCTPITLRFDRAGYNHYDGKYAYCFTLPSGEEFWLDFSDTLNTQQRLELLKRFMAW